MSIISPKSKDSFRIAGGSKASFFQNTMKKQNSQQNMSQNRSSRYSFFNKTNAKPLHNAVGANTTLVKGQSSKERKLRDDECSVEKSLPGSSKINCINFVY